MNAKAYQEFRVTAIHLVDPSVSGLLLLQLLLLTVRLAGIFLRKELSRVASTWDKRIAPLPEELCFHEHPASTLSKPLRSLDHRTKNESRRFSNFSKFTDPGSNRITPRSDSGGEGRECGGEDTQETTPHFAFTPKNCR